jgi:hypothetical protein
MPLAQAHVSAYASDDTIRYPQRHNVFPIKVENADSCYQARAPKEKSIHSAAAAPTPAFFGVDGVGVRAQLRAIQDQRIEWTWAIVQQVIGRRHCDRASDPLKHFVASAALTRGNVITGQHELRVALRTVDGAHVCSPVG